MGTKFMDKIRALFGVKEVTIESRTKFTEDKRKKKVNTIRDWYCIDNIPITEGDLAVDEFLQTYALALCELCKIDFNQTKDVTRLRQYLGMIVPAGNGGDVKVFMTKIEHELIPIAKDLARSSGLNINSSIVNELKKMSHNLKCILKDEKSTYRTLKSGLNSIDRSKITMAFNSHGLRA